MSVAISQIVARQVLWTRFWTFFIHFWSSIACLPVLPFSVVVVDSILTHFNVISKVKTFLFIVCTGFFVVKFINCRWKINQLLWSLNKSILDTLLVSVQRAKAPPRQKVQCVICFVESGSVIIAVHVQYMNMWSSAYVQNYSSMMGELFLIEEKRVES